MKFAAFTRRFKIEGKRFFFIPLWGSEEKDEIDFEQQSSGYPQAQQQLQSHPSQVEAKPSSKRGDSLQHLTSSRQTWNHLNSIKGFVDEKNQVALISCAFNIFQGISFLRRTNIWWGRKIAGAETRWHCLFFNQAHYSNFMSPWQA